MFQYVNKPKGIINMQMAKSKLSYVYSAQLLGPADAKQYKK